MDLLKPKQKTLPRAEKDKTGSYEELSIRVTPPAEPEDGNVSGFSIDDLPNELLDKVFSFLDFVHRVRIESVCTRWCMLARSPTTIRIDGNLLPSRVLDEKVVASLLSRCSSVLKELIIINSHTGLTSESIAKISEMCPNLVNVELHLIGIPQITSLKSMANGCRNLRVIKLDLLPSRIATGEDPDEQTNYEKYYKSYNEACDEGLLAIARNCRSLEYLYISNLANVSVSWLREINPKLRTLCLYDGEVTSDVLRCLMKTCNALQEFALDSCTSLDPGLLLEFLKHFKRTLKVLSINYQDSIEGEWQEVFNVLINLEVLQISSYELVDDAFLEFIAEKYVNLKSLDIGYSKVTDLGIIALQGLSNLKQLTIGQFSTILGYGLEMLAGKGVLEQVTVMPYNSELQEACRTIAIMYPKVQFHLME